MATENKFKDIPEADFPEVPMPEFTPPGLPVEPTIEKIGIAEELDEWEQKVGWLDAGGMPIWAIEKALGLQVGTVMTLRAKTEYRDFVLRCIRVKVESEVVKAGDDIEGLLNNEIGRDVAALMEVRDNPFEKGANRIRAAESLMDRAPKAPKAKREVEEKRTIIQIPIGELQTMKQALIEEGTGEDREVLELMEGVDFTSSISEDEDKDGEKIEITDFS